MCLPNLYMVDSGIVNFGFLVEEITYETVVRVSASKIRSEKYE